MATIHPTPREVEVRQMLAMLFGNDLTISEAEELPVSVESNNAAALYVADDGTPVTACVCDINFAAFAGSALTKDPARWRRRRCQFGRTDREHDGQP